MDDLYVFRVNMSVRDDKRYRRNIDTLVVAPTAAKAIELALVTVEYEEQRVWNVTHIGKVGAMA